ncbi:MAG: flagellar biosynthetic protein FliR [bacterium]|nr:MAG: flagellar biosynthetic protein FliR [bacterium]
MSLFDFNISSFIGFVMVFVRLSGLFFTMPVFGSSTVPIHAKVALVSVTSFIVFSVTNLPPVDLTMSVWKLTVMLAGELAIGLTVGFATQLVFTAIQLSGQIIGFQMGFAIVNVMDPTTNSQVSITAQFQNLVALMIFLAISGHHWLIVASVKSFDLIPVLGFTPSASLAETMLHLTSNVFITAVKIGAPIMATLFLLNVALGLVARTVPQMNVFIVGFPLQIGMGLFMVGATLPVFVFMFKRSLASLFENIILLMKLM